MVGDKRPLIILNLCGELPGELTDFFSLKGAIIVDPLFKTEERDWTHILTRDIHDFNLINKVYGVSKNDRKIISLSKVHDLQNFILNNGDLVLCDNWLKTSVGLFILNKYFQNFGEESDQQGHLIFKESGSFTVSNPFNTGDYIDVMVHKAFEVLPNALAVKTYIDHLLMYLSGLKTKGKAGLPFEVSYGGGEDIFAVQFLLYSPLVSIMDVATSLHSDISKKPEEYFLNVAVQSVDFFDFTFIPNVNKSVVTAIWSTDQRITFENRGMMLNSIAKGGLALFDQTDVEIEIDFKNKNITDLSDRIEIPDDLTDDAFDKLRTFQKIQEEELVQVDPSADINFKTQDRITHKEFPDEIHLLKSDEKLADVVQTIKGKFDEQGLAKFTSSGKVDPEKYLFHLVSEIDSTIKEKNMKMRPLESLVLPEIKKSFFDYAQTNHRDKNGLGVVEVEAFQNDYLQQILKNELLKLHPEESIEKKQNKTNQYSELEVKLAITESENQKLKLKLRTLYSELKISQSTKTKILQMNSEAEEASADLQIEGKSFDEDEELRNFYKQKLKTTKSVSLSDAEKLSALLERESQLITSLREYERKAKKMEIEASQKEAFYYKEMEKSERTIKNREISILKTRETFKKLVEKKDREISDLKNRNEKLSQTINSQGANQNSLKMKELEKHVIGLSKQVENYKIKLASMATNPVSIKDEGGDKEDLRKYQMIVQQLKTNLSDLKKEYEKVVLRAASDQAEINRLKIEKSQIEKSLAEVTKDRGSVLSQDIEQIQPKNDKENKRLVIQNQILETKVKDLTSKITNLETKLVESSRNQKTNLGVAEEGSKARVFQLETSLKKLTQDLNETKNQLVEAKKETNKMRQEKNALQNQVDKLMKDATKGKPGSKRSKVA